jgi:putative salt-induced outer membrane protein
MKTLATALLLALALPAVAQDDDPADEMGWDGTGELGFVSSSGNTRSDSVNARLGFKFEDEEWKHSFSLAGFRQRGEVVVLENPDDPDSGVRVMEENANRYDLGASTSMRLNDRNHLYTALRYENDDFAPYEYQGTLSVGWAHDLIDTERTDLDVQIGPGYKRTKDAVTHEKDGSFIGRMRVDLETRLTENTTLVDTLLVEAGSDNTFAQNDFGVKVAMNERFAVKAALQHRHNTDVPPERRRTDRLTTVNLVYDF